MRILEIELILLVNGLEKKQWKMKSQGWPFDFWLEFVDGIIIYCNGEDSGITRSGEENLKFHLNILWCYWVIQVG